MILHQQVEGLQRLPQHQTISIAPTNILQVFFLEHVERAQVVALLVVLRQLQVEVFGRRAHLLQQALFVVQAFVGLAVIHVRQLVALLALDCELLDEEF